MPVRISPRSKYHAIPRTIDGVRFASTREARRYSELRLLERAGQLWDLVLQPSFELHAPRLPPLTGGPLPWTFTSAAEAFVVVGVYRADFVYATKDGTIVEDAKGIRTALYSWKKKHVEIEYGVRIVEV